MKHLFLLLTLALLSAPLLHAQQINYESSYEKARALSIRQKKPLAVLITIRPPVYSPYFDKGLYTERVIERFNSNFINFKVDKEDTLVARRLMKEYNIYRLPSLIFFDTKGGLMLSDLAILADPQQLMGVIDKAIEASKENSLADYDSIYKSGNYNTSFLKSYIAKRERAGITNNADLIEKYVEGLKISDLNSYSEVLFILKAGPYADGNAYKLARTYNNLVDSIYKTEPLADRTAINNAIITNTMNNAIASKNLSRANAAANFTRGTWGKDVREGQRRYMIKMLDYYSGIKDTVRYLRTASSFYDQNYMVISVDSIRKIDSLNIITVRNNAMKNAEVVSSIRVGDTTFVRQMKATMVIAHENEKYAVELNNAAWKFYLMAGKNDDYLIKAMLWSRRSIELMPRAAFYDTYAHLLYKCKFYDEAETAAKKAIDAALNEKVDTKTFRESYEKIKKRTL